MDNVYFFFLKASNQSSWAQAAGSKQPQGIGFSVTLAFAKLLESVSYFCPAPHS